MVQFLINEFLIKYELNNNFKLKGFQNIEQFNFKL